MSFVAPPVERFPVRSRGFTCCVLLFARRRGRGENLLRRAGSLPAQDVADHDGRRSPSGPAPAPARESHGCAIWAKAYFGKGSIAGKRRVRKSAMRGIRPEGSRPLRSPKRPRLHRATDQARQVASTAATSAPRWRRSLRAASIPAPSWLCSLHLRNV